MNRMDSDRWKLIERLFNSALKLDPEERDKFLETACAGDNSLIKAVKRLLDHHEEAEDFLNVTPLDAFEGTQTKSHTSLLGRQISTYKIISEIGRGGMGQVYQAADLKLERDVAIKVLFEEFSKDDDRVKRFKREAKLLASLNHPNIAAIYGLEESEGKHFLAMELVDGDTLADRIKSGPVPVRETLKLVIQIADALEAAHKKGVIHRDLKPANIKITLDGKIKVLDFGLAKHVASNKPDTRKETLTYTTDDGTILGTLPYMSPEQIRGKAVDGRSDIFSLGLVIFEMLTGKHPFRRESNFDMAAAILNDKPPSLPKHAAGDRAAVLTAIIHKMIAKQVNDRYQNIEDVKNALNGLLAKFERKSMDAGPWRKFGNAKFVVPALVAIVLFGFLVIRNLIHENKASWARNTVLPQITELIQKDGFEEAYRLATEAAKYIPGDPQLKTLMEQVSGVWSIETNPPDARIYIKEYGSNEEDWNFLGNSPLENISTSRGFKEYKVIKEGFAERCGFIGTNDSSTVPRGILDFYDAWEVPISIGRRIRLVPDNSVLPNMVFIDGGYFISDISDLSNLDMIRLDDYLIDKYEVTNRDYMEFVIAGGYQESKYWRNRFVSDNQVISWKDAMAEFEDKTGQPGPATWEYGRYPDGTGQHPVTGISWYEAAAYAEFADKQLPSVYHWRKAADQQTLNIQPVTSHSNFTVSGTAPVGSYPGIGPYGTYDMAGNVREWCRNEYEEERFILGGAWGEPTLSYINKMTLPPMNRDPRNGFRCMKAFDSNDIPEDTMKPIYVSETFRNLNEIEPVSDEIFDIHRKSFYYEKIPLEPRPEDEEIDDRDSDYILETVSFNVPYDGERITAYIFIPKKTQKPYQPVIYFPGTSAWYHKSIHDYNATHVDIDLILKSGRAAIFPVYWGTFQRKLPNFGNYTRTQFRDWYIKNYKDLATTIDYLETRPEFDLTKLAYYGLSWGAGVGTVVGAIEKRIKGFIFVGGGIVRDNAYDGVYVDPLPEYDAAIFAPRITAPVLMINGKFDRGLPTVEILSNLLGTPEKDKRRIELLSGHVPPLDNKYIKEFLDWMNRYFGQVNKKSE